VSFYVDRFGGLKGEAGDTTVHSYGTELVAELPANFNLEAEYVTGDWDFTDEDPTGDDNSDEQDRYGLSLTLSHYTNRWLTPYLRYEKAEPDDDKGDDKVTQITLGVNMLIATNTFLKFEVANFNTQENTKKYLGDDFNELKAALSVGF
jgi:hypothetical protein